ncbi:MAG: zinc-binding dehydrogenase [Gemmatimonadota bacterium]|nr:zinc-binding dehydrogenase [Gemmatimonadota bacterium]
MKALTLAAHGGFEHLAFRADLPEPQLREPTDVIIRVRAAALNHLDLWLVEGLPGVTVVPPWVVGTDATGIVESVGPEVDTVGVGDAAVINAGLSDRACEYCRAGEHPLCVRFRVMGEHVPGLAAERVVVPATNVRTIPTSAPVEVAAGFTLAALTAWRMVVSRARVTEEDDVLIWGAGGGVAHMALQIAKLRGARVWVTSGSDAKLERARRLGADETLNHRTQDVPAEIRARTGKRGVTVVIDSVGEATWERSLRALGKRGRLVTCGGTSGPMVQTDVRRLFWNQWTIMGSTMGNDAEFDAVVELFRTGRLAPVVDSVFTLEDGRRAYERLASGEQFGKVVLRVGE